MTVSIVYVPATRGSLRCPGVSWSEGNSPVFSQFLRGSAPRWEMLAEAVTYGRGRDCLPRVHRNRHGQRDSWDAVPWRSGCSMFTGPTHPARSYLKGGSGALVTAVYPVFSTDLQSDL